MVRVGVLKRITEIVATIVMVLITVVALLAYYNYGSGALEIKISDPPISWGGASQVYLNYSSIEVHRAQPDNESGWFTVVENSAWINLTRTLDINQTIGHTNLQAGLYNLIRFRILGWRLTVKDKNYSAVKPNGQITIAITRGGIRVNTGQTTALLIDINVTVERPQFEGDNFKLIPDVKAMPV